MIDDMGFEKEITVMLDGEEYPLLLTTLATKQIAAKIGGLDKLKETLTVSTGEEAEMFDTICWLIALLVNQPIMKQNRIHRDNLKPLFEADDIALITQPRELGELMNKVSDAINRGSDRNVPDGASTEKN